MCDGPEWKLRPARDADRGFVRALSAEVFARFGNYGALLPPLLDSQRVRTSILTLDEAPVGFSMLSLEDLDQGELDLIAIAVSPDRQRHGVATRLLRHVEREGRALPVRRGLVLRLTVAEDNAPARALFRRAGFVVTPGERGRYAGGQRSLGMHKILCPDRFPYHGSSD